MRRKNMRCTKMECDMAKAFAGAFQNIIEDNKRMKDVLISAEKTLDYQSVGMYGRELLITLAQAVFDKAKHPSTDGTDIGAADSKRMLDAYIHYCMHKKSKEREVKFAKASVDFSNELTHNRTATAMEIMYNKLRKLKTA